MKEKRKGIAPFSINFVAEWRLPVKRYLEQAKKVSRGEEIKGLPQHVISAG